MVGPLGVSYIYGTFSALSGLRAIGVDLGETWIRRAVEWLRSVQNSDGGWGETCLAGNDPTLKGKCTSTPSQTAWALIGLLAGDSEVSEKRGARRGLARELPPGVRLVAAELAQRWALSPTPLREAFQRLEGVGLVELTSQRGARVASTSASEAEEIYELRLMLEPWALRRSLARSYEAHRAEVAAAHKRLFELLSRPKSG